MTSRRKHPCLAPRKTFFSDSADHYCQSVLNPMLDLQTLHYPTETTRSFRLSCQEPFPAATNPCKIQPPMTSLSSWRGSGDDRGCTTHQATPSRGAGRENGLTDLIKGAIKSITTVLIPGPQPFRPFLGTPQPTAHGTFVRLPAATVRAIPKSGVLSVPTVPTPMSDSFKFFHPHISPTLHPMLCFPSPRHTYLSSPLYTSISTPTCYSSILIFKLPLVPRVSMYFCEGLPKRSANILLTNSVADCRDPLICRGCQGTCGT